MLAAFDQTTVIVTVVTVLGSIIIAMLSRQGQQQRKAAESAEKAADAIGDKNGHGSVHESLATVFSRLDAQDSRAEQERNMREVGQQRQVQIQSALFDLRELVMSTRQDVAAFGELQAAVDHLRKLIGEPGPEYDPTPLITYVHEFKHSLLNASAKAGMAHDLTIAQLIESLEEAQRMLAEIRAERQAREPE